MMRTWSQSTGWASTRFGLLTALGASAMAGVAGCPGPTAGRLNSPPQGYTEYQHPMQDDLVYMGDNALLEDMSVSSCHFVPHTAQLNALGARRLNRYVDILKIYGGTLHYDGAEPDQKMVDDRVDRIRTYLADAGLLDDEVIVEAGMPGGRGMNADEAVDIRQATSFHPKKDTGGGLSIPLSPIAGGGN